MFKKFVAFTAALATASIFGHTKPAQAGMDPFVGEITLIGFNFCPRGWAAADGSLLAISSHQALFSLYGTTYGGDGVSTFALPDLRGRVAVHDGHGPGLTDRRIGQRGGAETSQLSVQNLPPHTHGLIASSQSGSTGNPAGQFLADAGREDIYGSGTSTAAMNHAAVTTTGSGRAINNMPPFLTLTYCVAMQGTYPSRS